MSKTKSLASLTPTLLARKGSAKPAMRPQFQPVQDATTRQLDDLGFNDMGHDAALGEVVELKPGMAEQSSGQSTGQTTGQFARLSEVRRLQARIASRIGQDTPLGQDAPLSKPRRSALADGRNAAFTLRLDADRHLELRLASALAGRSAQQLLTEALDKMINDLPEVADLAARVGKRN